MRSYDGEQHTSYSSNRLGIHGVDTLDAEVVHSNAPADSCLSPAIFLHNGKIHPTFRSDVVTHSSTSNDSVSLPYISKYV
jgi:hypothetical protein